MMIAGNSDLLKQFKREKHTQSSRQAAYNIEHAYWPLTSLLATL